MTKNDPPLAKVRYLSGDIELLSAGSHVACAVTGQLIEIEHLHYWDPDLQEAYASADIMLRRQKDKAS